MTNLAHLAQRRAKLLANVEAIADWATSPYRDERALYERARRAYELAERDYNRAISTLSPEEVAERSGVAA